ncbi:MAG: SDR family oxidoreductase [Herpetosiphonaceae bacterium]|nr:SDR family oxidoreductase [Herpetosiphonaceae bacterium]
MNLQDKVAIVTGAGSGIGWAIAERLSAEGAAIIVAEVAPAGGVALTELLTGRGARATFVRTDVSEEADAAAMIQAAVTTYGRLDILINNAGVNWDKPFLETTLADWERVISINLRGVFLGCRYAIAQLVGQGSGGSIINISSVHSVATLPGTTPYAASKGGISAMTRSLANEFGRQGIRVNAVCPGSIATRIWDEALAASTNPDAMTAHWRNNTAAGRLGTAREVASMVAWLCTDDASYVTGANLFVDGGLTSMLTNTME